MAFPAMWIRQNMFRKTDENATKERVVYGRSLTEAEIRVQKSLEKLSIPDWYLNNSSRPPKILMQHTPIESRPSSWKTFQKKASNTSTSFSKLLSVGPKSDGHNATKNQSSKQQKKNESTFFKRSSPEKVDAWGKKTLRMKKPNISRSYPKVSPSRKIRNINLVFPQPYEKLDIDIDNLMLPKNSVESLEVSGESDNSMSSSTNVETLQTELINSDSDHAEKCTMPISSRFATYTKKSSSKQTKNQPKVLDSKSSALKNLNYEVPSTQEKFQVRPLPTTPVKTSIPVRAPSPKLKNTTVPDEKIQFCANCKANISKAPIDKPAVIPREYYPRKFTKPMEHEISKNTLSRQSSSASNMTFILSPNKSMAMESIVKKNSKKHETSLVQDIIAELEEKCKTSPQPTYNSVGSRKFVRDLVKALESDEENGKEIDRNKENISFIESEKYIEDDVAFDSNSEPNITSAADSTSISFKDTDSGSDFESKYGVTCNQVRYDDWKISKPQNENQIQNDDHVYWVPVERTDFPRTSSLLSFSSRRSATSSAESSPSFASPIGNKSGIKLFQKNKTRNMFRNRRSSPSAKKLFCIDETTVILDSGYSEKSGPSSFLDETYCTDFERSQTPSVTDSVSVCSSHNRTVQFRTSAILGKSIIV